MELSSPEEVEILGEELLIYVQTEKYLRIKNDSSLLDSTKRILRENADDNRERRQRLNVMLGETLTEADYFADGQGIQIKGSTPAASLSDALEYLITNSFSLKRKYLPSWKIKTGKRVQIR